MKKRFKDERLQKIYEYLLTNPPLNKDGSENWGSSLHEGFWKGYNGVPFKYIVSLSWFHAAWAAGQDCKKKGGIK